MKKHNKQRLFEIMDRVAGTSLMESPETIEINGKKHFFTDLKVTTYAFIYLKETDDMIVSKRNGTHGDAVVDYFGLDINNPAQYKFLSDIAYKNPKNVIKGRIWYDQKVLSFWGDYILKGDVEISKEKLKEKFPTEDFNQYRIDEYNDVV